MYTLAKKILFLLSPEKAHYTTLGLFRVAIQIPLIGRMIRKSFKFEHPRLEKELFGLTFKNPIGLAAGFDKDARYINTMKNLGFGFYEIGTVTPRPQIGNPKPRLFRLDKDDALINRMGFNNLGVEAAVRSLKQIRRHDLIIGGNIGKNKDTPNINAVEDYLICFEKLFDHVDYFVVNVSSPNTPGLRSLQAKEPLQHLLSKIQEANLKKSSPKPILLKISPDLNHHQLDDILEIVRSGTIDGIIACNTTIAREGLSTASQKIESIGNGGLSGNPVREKSTQVIRYLHTKSKGSIPIIGVGGINDVDSAIEKLEAGASLIQIYTGLIYRGPALISQIKRALTKKYL